LDAAGTSGRDGEDLGGYLVILDIGFDWGNVTKGAAADAAAPLDYVDISFRAIPHNSKCRYGERGAADAKPKAQIILDVLSSILATQMPCRSCRSGA
jgi:hypothetical protein